MTTKLSRVLTAGALSLALGLTGCASGDEAPTPPGVSAAVRTEPLDGRPSAADAVATLVQALQTGKLDDVAFVQDAAQVADDYRVVIGGMDDIRPTIIPQPVAYFSNDADQAAVQLDHTYPFAGQNWTFSSTARLAFIDNAWRVEWDPAIVHPALTAISRLRHTRDVPRRASILGAHDVAIVEERPVYQVGIDKSVVTPEQAVAAANSLAALLKIDAAGYITRVEASGDKAFVPAITMREGQVPAGVDAIEGAVALPDTQMLAPSKTFAQSILGVSGPASQEFADAHEGVEVGDTVGLTGLQERYDTQLRGKAGHTITIVRRQNPSPFGATAPDNPSADPATFAQSTAFSAPAVPGEPLRITLNLEMQTKAEATLAAQPGVASLVVIDNESGGILAAANSPASGAQSDATFGRYAPGSTFKVATSLALIRKGLTPASSVNCPATLKVSGWTYKNYSDYPASMTGRISLTQALAHSCNTAFMAEGEKLSAAELQSAAGSLGVGTDYDAGFPAFYGSIPGFATPGERATAMIGQGKVEASPLAMAGLAASVARGKTTVAWLVDGHRPAATGQPLTESEAAALRTLMGAVVTQGSGQTLEGLMSGAKTGTAEYGVEPKTHAWMIAYNDRYSVAAFVKDGQSGSGSAAPLIKAFFGP